MQRGAFSLYCRSTVSNSIVSGAKSEIWAICHEMPEATSTGFPRGARVILDVSK